MVAVCTPAPGAPGVAPAWKSTFTIATPCEGSWPAAGLTEWFAGALVGLYQDYRRSGTGGYAAQVTDTVTRLAGRQARSLDDLLGEVST